MKPTAAEESIRDILETLIARVERIERRLGVSPAADNVEWIDCKDAAALFGMTHQSIKNAITREPFPVPTYKLGKRRVIDRDVLAAYFAERRAEGMTELNGRKL
jgi:hypothetical protein